MTKLEELEKQSAEAEKNLERMNQIVIALRIEIELLKADE